MTAGTESPATRQVLWLTASCSLLAYLLQFMFPTLAVGIARELHLPVGDVLGWSFAGYLLFGLGALPGGYLANIIGPRRALLIGLAGSGVSALAVAEAAPGRSLVLCLAALGFFGGFHYPATMVLLGRLDSGARARCNRFRWRAGALGFALAPIVGVTLAGRYGSRQAFAVAGFAASGLAAALGMWRADIDNEPPEAVAQAAGGVAPGKAAGVLVTAAVALASVSLQALAIALPATFAQRASALNFGVDTSVVYLIGLLACLAGEQAARHRDQPRLLMIVQAATVLPVLLMRYVDGLPLHVAAAAAATCGFAGQSTTTRLFERFTAAPPVSAMGYGVRCAITAGVASLGVPLVTWGATRGGNVSDAFLLIAAVAACSAVAAPLLLNLAGALRAPAVAARAPAAHQPTVAASESG